MKNRKSKKTLDLLSLYFGLKTKTLCFFSYFAHRKLKPTEKQRFSQCYLRVCVCVCVCVCESACLYMCVCVFSKTIGLQRAKVICAFCGEVACARAVCR